MLDLIIYSLPSQSPFPPFPPATILKYLMCSFKCCHKMCASVLCACTSNFHICDCVTIYHTLSHICFTKYGFLLCMYLWCFLRMQSTPWWAFITFYTFTPPLIFRLPSVPPPPPTAKKCILVHISLKCVLKISLGHISRCGIVESGDEIVSSWVTVLMYLFQGTCCISLINL